MIHQCILLRVLGHMSKVILYLKKRITVYFLWLLTPREIILRQRDKIYGINLSTRKQSAMLFFVVGALGWLLYSSLFYVNFDNLIAKKNQKISDLNDNLIVAKKDQKKLGNLEKKASSMIFNRAVLED